MGTFEKVTVHTDTHTYRGLRGWWWVDRNPTCLPAACVLLEKTSWTFGGLRVRILEVAAVSPHFPQLIFSQ